MDECCGDKCCGFLDPSPFSSDDEPPTLRDVPQPDEGAAEVWAGAFDALEDEDGAEEYMVVITRRVVDDIAVYDAFYGYTPEHEGDTESYVGPTGLKRLMAELRDDLRED